MGVLEPSTEPRIWRRVGGFNPWKGFGGFGTCVDQVKRWTQCVSIPGRDLGVLEPGGGSSIDSAARVSIPGRDLGVLEHSEPSRYTFQSFLFQSLEGIWGFWNILLVDRHSWWILVSIPGRDLGVLEPQWNFPAAEEMEGFNPWKGFGGFGTRRKHSVYLLAQCSFNPWKGFGGFGTPMTEGLQTFLVVSIPGRDLGVLEPLNLVATSHQTYRFNPWKGFGGFGTIALRGLERV